MQVFGNRIQKPYNCGILVIGSQFSEIHSNVIHESANAGIMQWSSCDCVYKNNYLYNCNQLQHNGIGNLGDAFGNIVLDGAVGIAASSGEKYAVLIGNTVVKAGQGLSLIHI